MRVLLLTVTLLLLCSCYGYHNYTAVSQVCSVGFGAMQINAVSSNHFMADQELQIVVNGRVVGQAVITQQDDWKVIMELLHPTEKSK